MTLAECDVIVGFFLRGTQKDLKNAKYNNNK
jgi:hypothetical protein